MTVLGLTVFKIVIWSILTWLVHEDLAFFQFLHEKIHPNTCMLHSTSKQYSMHYSNRVYARYSTQLTVHNTSQYQLMSSWFQFQITIWNETGTLWRSLRLKIQKTKEIEKIYILDGKFFALKYDLGRFKKAVQNTFACHIAQSWY